MSDLDQSTFRPLTPAAAPPPLHVMGGSGASQLDPSTFRPLPQTGPPSTPFQQTTPPAQPSHIDAAVNSLPTYLQPGGNFAAGIFKSVAEAVNTAGEFGQKLAGVHNTQATIPVDTELHGVSQHFGGAAEMMAELFLAPELAPQIFGEEGLSLAGKVKGAKQMLDAAEESPVIASMLRKSASRIITGAAKTGTLTAGQAALHGGTPEEIATSGTLGAGLGGVGGALGSVGDVATGVKSLLPAAEDAAEGAAAKAPAIAPDLGAQARALRQQAQQLVEEHAGNYRAANAARAQALDDYRAAQTASRVNATGAAQEQLENTQNIFDQHEQDFRDASDVHRQARLEYEAELKTGEQQDDAGFEAQRTQASADRQTAMNDYRVAQRQQDTAGMSSAQARLDKANNQLREASASQRTAVKPSAARISQMQGRVDKAMADRETASADYQSASQSGDKAAMADAQQRMGAADDVLRMQREEYPGGANAERISAAKAKMDAAADDLMNKQNFSAADKITARRQALDSYARMTKPAPNARMSAASDNLTQAMRQMESIRNAPGMAQAQRLMDNADTMDELHQIVRKSVDGIQDADIAGRTTTLSPLNGKALLKNMNKFLDDPANRTRAVNAMGQDGLDNLMHMAQDHATTQGRAEMGTALDSAVAGMAKGVAKHLVPPKFRMLYGILKFAATNPRVYNTLRLARNANPKIAAPLLGGMLNHLLVNQND